MQERYFPMIGVDGTIPLDGRGMAAIYASRPDFAKYIESMFRDCLEALCGFAGHLIASRYIIMLHKVIKGKLVISDKVQAKTNTF
jgi:hypothetical protein